MKTALAIVMTLALAALGGCCCHQGSGGDPVKDDGFQIAVPTSNTEVEQGQVQTVTVTLQRGQLFKQDVRLQFTASNGISVDPNNFVIKVGDRPDVQIQISAPVHASPGKYSIAVKGTPETGEPISTGFTVEVVRR